MSLASWTSPHRIPLNRPYHEAAISSHQVLRKIIVPQGTFMKSLSMSYRHRRRVGEVHQVLALALGR